MMASLCLTLAAFLHLISNAEVDSIIKDRITRGAALCKMYSGGKQLDKPVLDCSYRNLESIPTKMDNTTLRLDLNDNKLGNITGSPFKKIGLLRSLSLAHSDISFITSNVFDGLYHLRELFLSSNRITSLPADIFSDLKHLEFLDLSYNFLNTIPNRAVAPLKSLQILDLQANDFTSFTLGKEFLSLRNLSLLILANLEPSLKGNITNETFQYLNVVPQANLELYLIWRPEYITLASVGAIKNVKSLWLLDQPLDHFESTECSLETLTLASILQSEMVPLQHLAKWNLTLTSLSLNSGHIQEVPKSAFSSVPLLRILNITDHDLSFLSDDAFIGLENLEELVLSHNHLQNVPSNALGVFTKYGQLKYLDLSYNGIVGSIPADAFAAVSFLTSLNLAGNRIDLWEDWTRVLVNLTHLNLEDTYINMYPAHEFPLLKTLLLGVSKRETEIFTCFGTVICTLANYLQKIVLSNNVGCYKTLAAIIGSECLYLAELDISGLFVEKDGFSTHQPDINLPSLEVLKSAHNKMTSLMQLQFIRAPKVEELDLSYNEIQAIELDSVTTLDHLKYLNLEGNKLSSLMGLGRLSSLEVLLVAKNKITTVPTFLLHKPREAALETLDLGDNPFDCTCNIMGFKKWLTDDNFTWLVPNNLYLCASPDNMKGRSISEIDLDCRSHLAIYLSIGISCAFLLLILMLLGARYQWHIKYKLFLFFNNKRVHNYIDDDHALVLDDEAAEQGVNIPRYDAYIAYAEDCAKDERWVINVLRPKLEEGPEPFQLYIRGRDSIPGDTIIESISDSIQKSHKTVLILTPQFVESEWCYFEMQMARMRLFNENRDVIVLIMLEDVPENKLTLGLRQLLCKHDYFKWPADKYGQNLFWRRLREELKKPVGVDRRYIL